MFIVGAGLSGLIAASMLRDNIDRIWEAQKELPNNHSALLRFRSSVVGDATGIPFKKVQVMKAVVSTGNPVKDAISYSLKCTGKAELRSITSATGAIEERYVAPDDFIQRLANQVTDKISLNCGLDKGTRATENQIISTIPMPALMDHLGWKDKPDFSYIGGTVVTCDLPSEIDIYATIYYPDPTFAPYRASITGRRLMIEISDVSQKSYEGPQFSFSIMDAVDSFGLCDYIDYVKDNSTVKRMQYAKISPIDEGIRKRFILWASEKHNFYSLGRFATWRPGLLLDDIVNDVRVIQRLINGDHSPTYKARKG